MNFLKLKFQTLFAKSTEDKSTNNNNNIIQKPELDQKQDDMLREIFEKVAEFIAKSEVQISQQAKLDLYGLYKQATVGDCNTPKPGMLDFVGKAKWDVWNQFKGTKSHEAKQLYIKKASEVDHTIQKKLKAVFQPQNNEKNEEPSIKIKPTNIEPNGVGLKIIQQKDYTSSYSHPYFKPIQKNQQLKNIEKHLLLQKNNSPKVYPLHFAIDKERVDLVQEFLKLLTIEEIEAMEDEDGTGILQYAELIENQQILKLVEQKLQKQK